VEEKITQTNQDPPIFIPKRDLPFGRARERLRLLGDFVGKRRAFVESERKEIRSLEARARVETVLEEILNGKADTRREDGEEASPPTRPGHGG
jgi:hypothetical protein